MIYLPFERNNSGFDMENVVNMRKLVALDILLHGRPFILVEFGLGTSIILGLSVQLISVGLAGASVGLVIGSCLLFTGINYLPLLVYAIIISKNNSAQNEAESELQNKSKYNRQQFLIFVPLLILLLTIKQELGRTGNS